MKSKEKIYIFLEEKETIIFRKVKVFQKSIKTSYGSSNF